MVTSPAVPSAFVDDDRALRVLPLELLEEFGDTLGLRHDDGRPQQAGNRARVVAGAERDQILHEHEAGDVVEALPVDREPRVLLFAEQRPEIADRRVHLDGNDIRPGRHYFADQRVAEVDDALEQLGAPRLR